MLTRLDDRRFDAVEISDMARVLNDGVEFCAVRSTQDGRWLLTRRQLFVLAPGGEFGVCGHISVPKALIGVEHTLLIGDELFEGAKAVLAEAGCSLDLFDAASALVPGWRLVRGVTPKRSVPATDDRDILNALRPVADVRAQFSGGIRVQTREWLVGFPPLIRFTGALPDDFVVKIDDKPARVADDGAFEADGWNDEGEHRLWFADQAENYRIVRATEQWGTWQAHDFGLGSGICGAAVHHTGTGFAHLMVPMSNPLLIGVNPGEVFLCAQRSDVRAERIFASIPFEPAWALPADPAHCDKRSARIVQMGRAVSPAGTRVSPHDRKHRATIRRWCAAINDAGRKGLKLATANEDAGKTWTEYRKLARSLHRKMR